MGSEGLRLRQERGRRDRRQPPPRQRCGVRRSRWHDARMTIALSVDTAAGSCSYLLRHSPRNLSTERHHVIPVAWQLFWQPPQPWPYPGQDFAGRGQLWDDRTVTVCPTCHRNTHVLIVGYMHGLSAPGGALPVRRKLQEVTAGLAIERFETAGGDVQALISHSLWGQS